jgi:hypothetical protein
VHSVGKRLITAVGFSMIQWGVRAGKGQGENDTHTHNGKKTEHTLNKIMHGRKKQNDRQTNRTDRQTNRTETFKLDISHPFRVHCYKFAKSLLFFFILFTFFCSIVVLVVGTIMIGRTYDPIDAYITAAESTALPEKESDMLQELERTSPVFDKILAVAGRHDGHCHVCLRKLQHEFL